MKKLAILVVVLFTVAFIGSAMAVPPGKTSMWDAPMGKVTFDGTKHKDAGLACTDCHSKIFQMKAGSFDAKMADHNTNDKFCWSCHNGDKTFESKGNCNKCHVK